jgi:hypothetical protein
MAEKPGWAVGMRDWRVGILIVVQNHEGDLHLFSEKDKPFGVTGAPSSSSSQDPNQYLGDVTAACLNDLKKAITKHHTLGDHSQVKTKWSPSSSSLYAQLSKL